MEKFQNRMLRQFLPYVGIPVVCAAILIRLVSNADAFALLRLETVAVLGYAAAILDLKTKRIANGLILLMLGAWVLLMTPMLFYDTAVAVATLADSASGFAAGGALFLLVYLISRNGLGGGDVKFMAASGLYLGFSRTVPAILFGSVLAALTGLTLLLCKKIGRKDTIPLAPFLYIGMLLAVFLGGAPL